MNFTRTFDAARREQGFRSQAELDAFFRYYDHTKECAECHKPGPAFPLDDGMQPTQHRCATALRLYADAYAA